MSETILFPYRGFVPPRPPKAARVFRLPRMPLKRWVPWILCTVILALAAYEHFGHETRQPADLETRALASGRAFVPHLAAALADGFDAAAHAIQNGKSVSEADSVLKQVFHDARAKANRLAGRGVGLEYLELESFLAKNVGENSAVLGLKNVTELQLPGFLRRGHVVAHVDGNHWVRVLGTVRDGGSTWVRIYDPARGTYEQLLTSFMTRAGQDNRMILVIP